MVKIIDPRRSGFKPDPLIQFKSMPTNENLSTVMCFDLETYQDGQLYRNNENHLIKPDKTSDKIKKDCANFFKRKTDKHKDEWISGQKIFLISIVVGRFDHHNFFLVSECSLISKMSPQITRLPDIDMDIQAEILSDGKNLLRRFFNIIGNHQPHCHYVSWFISL
ncbi:hypothetical protein P9112_005362 [Eukaryota sp. TZLM1-RC]